MFKNKGIVFKMFIFTSALIVFVVIISFSILYAVMPKYYLYIKNNMLEKNSNILVQDINKTTDKDELIKTIIDFSLKNNAEVISFDAEDKIVFDYSSSFIQVSVSENYRNNMDRNYVGNRDDIQVTVNMAEEKMEVTSVKMNAMQSQLAKISSINIKKEVENKDFKTIKINSTLQSIGEANYVIFSLMPYLLIVDIIIAFIGALFFSKQFTKPIIKLSQTAQSMQYLTPNVFSNIQTNDEFGTLSKNLDFLYFKLCSNIETLKVEIEKVSILEKYKTDFMRAASHELKTPIAALNGIIEGMIDGVGKFKDRDKYLLECKKMIDKLTLLVSEILLSSKFENAKHILQIEKVNILEVVNQNIKNNKLFIEEKNLKIFFNAADLIIETDKNIISNTISNILSNAVRYTKKNNKINILIDQSENILSIENECESIKEEDLKKLFEPFYTISNSRDKTESGNGLGLFIVKNNLKMLNIRYSIKNTKLGIQFNIYFDKN